VWDEELFRFLSRAARLSSPAIMHPSDCAALVGRCDVSACVRARERQEFVCICECVRKRVCVSVCRSSFAIMHPSDCATLVGRRVSVCVCMCERAAGVCV